MANVIEQLRYLDDQLQIYTLTAHQAELVRVHRLMGLQLRAARLQDLQSAPPPHSPDFEQWERCRKDIENEVELNLAETRLSVEGLEDSWEKWLHYEKLKTIKEQILQQQASNDIAQQNSQILPESHDMGHKDGLDSQGNVDGVWESIQDVEAHEWDDQQQLHPHAYRGSEHDTQEYDRSHEQHVHQYHQAREHEAQEYQRRQEGDAQLREDSGQHHAHELQPPEENQNGANPGHPAEAYPEGQEQGEQQWQEGGTDQEVEHNTGNVSATVQMKLCRRCNTHKPVTQFYKSKANADGYDGRCKTCDAVQCAQRRKRKERIENPTVEWKACRRCGLNKPAADFYRNKTNGDGLYNNCKICFSHDAASRRERLPPLEERTATAKKCRRCKETKPASEFYKNKHMSDGLYTHCKACYTEAANLRSAGRAPAETKRCRRCGHTKEASDFYISKMTADGLQSYCKACYAVASAARRSRTQHDHAVRSKEMEDYAVQQVHLQEQYVQSQLDHMQVMGVPHMALSSGIHPNQLQQLGYDPSMIQGGLEDQGLEHQGLDPQDLEQAQYADHPGHHILDPQTQHMLDASLGHAGHPGLSGVHHLDPHGGIDQQVLDSHALGHHPGGEHDMYAQLEHDTGLLHAHGVGHLQMHPSHYQEESLQG